MTQFTFGAINPLTIGSYTLREVFEYLAQMEQASQNNPITPL